MEYQTKSKGFIEENLSSSFFDSLRDDYKEFNDWYKKSVNDENRSSFYWKKDKEIIAFIGLKSEDEELKIGSSSLGIKNRIKITTIKSGVDLPRFSEMAFYKAFKKARDEEIEEVYFSIIPDTEEKLKLVEIAKSFGFKEIGKTKKSMTGIERKNYEVYLMKNIKEPTNDWKSSYPRLPLKESRQCRLITLENKYHDNFLQDAILKETELKQDFSKMSIKKVYVHNQKNIFEMTSGDMAFLYRKSDKQKTHKSVITSYCVIIDQKQKGVDYTTFEEFKLEIQNIHAFDSMDAGELRDWFDNNKFITIFGYIRAFGEGNNINHKWLKENGLFFGNDYRYPTMHSLNNNEIKKIFKQGGIDV